jgi:hypothetical protein
MFLDRRQWCARDPRVEKGIAVGQELRRSFIEKFGQSTIDKHIPTVTAWVSVNDVVVLYFSRYPLEPGCSLRVRNLSCGVRCDSVVSLSRGQQLKMFSVLEAPYEQDEPKSRSRAVLCGMKAFIERNRAYARSGTINVAASETGSSHILVCVKLPNCRKYTLV